MTRRADAEVIGYPVLTVWASVQGHDDGDLHVHVEKLDARGRQLWHQTVTLGPPLARTWMPIAHRGGLKMVAPAFYGGPHGVLRLSRRGLEPASPADHPTLSLREEHRLAPARSSKQPSRCGRPPCAGTPANNYGYASPDDSYSPPSSPVSSKNHSSRGPPHPAHRRALPSRLLLPLTVA